MASDLNYFYERVLDKTNIKDFYESLPGHLKSKFKASLHTTIEWANVLQGYRGPSNFCNNGSGDSEALSPSHGIQEIKYWWGVRKDINAQVPVLGTLIFGLGRIVQNSQGNLEWSSLYFDSKTGECLSHDKNEAAEKLNTKGCQLFEEGRYSEAAEYHNNAYQACSGGYRNEQTFKNNANKAKSELKATNLNSQGDNLFRQGKYSEACDKYREAYNTSQVSAQYRIYKANREKAQCEIDAIDLNSQADSLFRQGKYSEAESKYREAYDKSDVKREKDIYSSNKDKVQTILDCHCKLSMLDHLWAEAWEAENDIKSDRSEQAKEIFHRILNEAKDSAAIFPGILRFKQYESLATLKLEGNKIFNQGLESQQNGITLFQAGQELKQQEKYELANEALEKFETGSKSDRRFVSCVQFVQEQISEVIKSIEITEQHELGAGLHKLDVDINSDNHSDDIVCASDGTEEHKNYYSQI